MTRAQTRLRPAAPLQPKKSPAFQLVREGEPLTTSIPPRLRIKQKREVERAQLAAAAEPHCPLCDGVITRFDMEVYDLHGRCAPCHQALGEE